MLLRGHIQTFYVKHNGRRLGPYYARVWRQNGRRRRQYIPAHKLEQTIAACQNYRERRKRQIEQRAELERILGNLSFLTRACRRAKRIEHLLPHEQDHVRRIQAEGIAAPGRPSVWRRRGFMGYYRKLWVQKMIEIGRKARGTAVPAVGPSTVPVEREEEPPKKEPLPLPECMVRRLREAQDPSHLPFTTYHLPTEPSQPQAQPSKRYWRLPHELPAWFTEELWHEMASRIPQDPKS